MPCATTLKPEQLATLAKIPTLVMFGDHLGDVQGRSVICGRRHFDTCNTFVKQVNGCGRRRGDDVALPKMGIKGNSHMLMQDKNNVQLADLILGWIDSTWRAIGVPLITPSEIKRRLVRTLLSTDSESNSYSRSNSRTCATFSVLRRPLVCTKLVPSWMSRTPAERSGYLSRYWPMCIRLMPVVSIPVENWAILPVEKWATLRR